MDSRDPHPEPQATWLGSMARADADVAGGRIVDGAVIHMGLLESIARMEHDESVVPAANSAPLHWQDALDEADRDVIAWRVVSADEVHAMLRERRR